MSNKSIVKIAIKVVFLLLFSFFIIRTINFTELSTVFLKTNISTFVYSISFKLVGILFSVFVLSYSLNLVAEKIKFTKLSEIYFLSYFFSNLGLGSLGGDSYKWLQVIKFVPSKLKTTYILVTEKILGMGSLFAFVLISIFIFLTKNFNLLYYLSTPILSICIVIGIFSFVRLLVKVPFLTRNQFIKNISDIHVPVNLESLKIIAYSSVFSCLFYLATIFSFFVIYRSLNPELPLYLAFFIIPIVIFINTIPISFQGLGIREASIAFLFTYLGFSFEVGVAASLILLIVNLSMSLLSGVYYSFILFSKR